MFEDAVKIELLRLHCLPLPVHAWIHPSIDFNGFLSDSVEITFCEYTKTLFTWSGGPQSSGVSFFCFHALGDTKQKKLTPLDRGPPLHVNTP